MIPFIPIIAIILTIILGIPIIYFTVAVLEILKIVMLILIMPFLIKYISDYMLNFKLGLGENVSLGLGMVFSLILAYMLYINFYALVIGGVIIFILYFIARNYAGDVLAMTKWFKGRKS